MLERNIELLFAAIRRDPDIENVHQALLDFVTKPLLSLLNHEGICFNGDHSKALVQVIRSIVAVVHSRQ
jgi:hypothetical protein